MRTLLLRLVVGLILGAAGGYGVTWWSSAAARHAAEERARRAEAFRKSARLVPLAVAGMQLPAGTELTSDMLSQRNVPESLTSAATIRADGASVVLGKRLLLPISPGDPILTTHLAETYTPEGARAFCDYLREVRAQAPRDGGTP
jgi:Flp pilus assembly protein CpaB